MDFFQKRLTVLKNKGFYPKVIYDIGANQGEWTRKAKEVFPVSNFYLFEANDAHIPTLSKQSSPFFIELLGDKEEEVVFHSINGTGDSIFRERTKYYSEGLGVEKKLQMTTLDSVVKKNQIPLPDFIKMDVQGAEKMIIEASSTLISSAEVIQLEVGIIQYNIGAPLIFEIMELMDRIHYQMIDIVDGQYTSEAGQMIGADLFFAKKKSFLLEKGLISFN